MIGSDGDEDRSCVDCGTVKTPMWRSGPMGPKSLCNACGIRFKKSSSVNKKITRGGNNTIEKAGKISSQVGKKTSSKKKKRTFRSTYIPRLDREDELSSSTIVEVIDFYHYKPLFAGLMVVDKKRGF